MSPPHSRRVRTGLPWRPLATLVRRSSRRRLPSTSRAPLALRFFLTALMRVSLQCIEWVKARITLAGYDPAMWREDHQVRSRPRWSLVCRLTASFTGCCIGLSGDNWRRGAEAPVRVHGDRGGADHTIQPSRRPTQGDDVLFTRLEQGGVSLPPPCRRMLSCGLGKEFKGGRGRVVEAESVC